MAEANAWNRGVIDQFRANAGKVTAFSGRPLLLLTTTGAKSGRSHTTPLLYSVDGDRLVVIASNSGAPTTPAWYYNLVAHPTATVELGSDTFEVEATVAAGEERERLYRQQATRLPEFATYERRTTRQIPVVVLRRKQ